MPLPFLSTVFSPARPRTRGVTRGLLRGLAVVLGMGYLACGWSLAAAAAPEAPTPAPAPAAVNEKADPAVGLALDEVKADYEVVDDGDYKLTIGFDDKRSQVVFVTSTVEKLQKMDVREVWAIANLYVPGNEPAEVAVALLKDNSSKILGAWQLRDFGDRTGLIYCMQIPANLDAQSLRTAYQQAAVIADDKEKELTAGKDEF